MCQLESFSATRVHTAPSLQHPVCVCGGMVFAGTQYTTHSLPCSQVLAPAGDEWARPVRSDLDHERRYAKQVPAGRLDQVGLLSVGLLLLSLRDDLLSNLECVNEAPEHS